MIARRADTRLLDVVRAFKALSGGQLAIEVVVCLQASASGLGPNSTSAAATELRAAGATVVRVPAGLGYAAAIDEALQLVQYEMVALFDPGDGYHASDLPRLMSRAAHHDMVVGSRQQAGKSSFERRFVRRMLRALAELATGQAVPDATSGFRVLRRAMYSRYAPLAFRGSGISSMLTVGMLTDGLGVAFVPISYDGTSGRGRPLRAWLELLHLMARITLLFNPLRVLSLPGYTLSFAGALLLGLSAWAEPHPATWSAVAGLLCLGVGGATLAVAFLADLLGGLGRAILTLRR